MSPKNKTITLSESESHFPIAPIPAQPFSESDIENQIFCADAFQLLPYFPKNSIDLLILDPPYNLNKNFHGVKFSQTNDQRYFEYINSWLPLLIPLLKRTASVYFCSDWKSSQPVYQSLSRYFIVRNRITWQREKGRASNKNWKNQSEDIWFATVSNDYYFNPNAVKIKKRVVAPYKENNQPKDWTPSPDGNYRLTAPSNFWNDIVVPFWSMPENTPHPTQKPEKLIAKLILASSKPRDFVLDIFMGSGSTPVVASKLDRRYCGIDINPFYCALAKKRLELAKTNKTIQGYKNGAFLERNDPAA